MSAICRCYIQSLLWKTLKSLEERKCAGVYWLLKKGLWNRCFPLDFRKFPRTPFGITPQIDYSKRLRKCKILLKKSSTGKFNLCVVLLQALPFQISNKDSKVHNKNSFSKEGSNSKIIHVILFFIGDFEQFLLIRCVLLLWSINMFSLGH